MDVASVGLVDFEFETDGWLERVRRTTEAEPLGRLGDYEVMSVAGHGGQATVYCCRRFDGVTVAVKRLHGGAVASRAARERIVRELDLAAKLDHPSIVAARAVQIDGEPLLEMDWVDGIPLNDWAAAGEDDRRRTPAELLGMFEKICAAVQHAHGRGVLHCDLKPSNILVDRTGQPRILDFGISRPLAECGATTTLTATEILIGTPAYASPEQVGSAIVDLDVRSDVYSLGVLFYEALTGVSPYPPRLSLGRLLCAIEDWDPQRPRALNRQIPPSVDSVVMRALEKDPRKRYATAAQLHEDIERCLRGDRPLARHPVIRAGLRRFRKRRPIVTWLSTGVALVLLVLAIIGVLNWKLHRSGQAYVDEVVKVLATTWDPQEYFKRTAAEVREVVPDERVVELFETFGTRMGPMIERVASAGDAEFVLSPQETYRAAGQWKSRVRCVRGTCTIETQMIWRDGRWQLTCFIVTPDVVVLQGSSDAPPPTDL
jgi:tRNA A-37 threonylcarbamoyl transferase component Bud32